MNSEKSVGPFIDNGDDTVTSVEHGLMWAKMDSMNDLKNWVNYQDSVDYVRELNAKKFAGYVDWRLPMKDDMPTLYNKDLKKLVELHSILHQSCAKLI